MRVVYRKLAKTHMIHTCIESIRHLTDATTASLLFAPPSKKGFAPILLKAGDAGPIVGFETEESALETSAKLVQSQPYLRITDTYPAARYYKGTTEDTHHFRIEMSPLDSMTAAQHTDGSSIEPRQDAPLNTIGDLTGYLWVELHYATDGTPEFLRDYSDKLCQDSSGESHSAPNWLTKILVAGTQIAWQAYKISALLQEPVTGLARRSELKKQINQTLIRAVEDQRCFALLLLNPNEFEQVNLRLDHERGDAVLREIGTILERSVRDRDTVYHYGGAVFAVLLWLPDEAKAYSAADGMRMALCDHVYFKGKMRLDFHVGVSCYGGELDADLDLDGDEVLRRASSALNAAKVSGGAKTILWARRGFKEG